MICRHCQFEFDAKHSSHKALGKVDECADCATDIKKTKGVTNGVGKSDVRLIIQRNPKEGINHELNRERL